MVLPKTSYKICGSGKNVVFLHGWASNKESFDGVIATLSQFYRCISFDFWGFGKSDKPKTAWSVDEYANAVLLFLKELGIEKCYVVAHSFGGRVAIKLCEKAECIEKLVLCGSAGLKPRFNMKTAFKIWQYKRAKKLVECGKLSCDVLKKFGSQDYKNCSPLLKEILLKVVNEDLCYHAKQIKVKTKLVYGKFDNQTPLYMARRFLKLINGSSLSVLKAGHFCFIDQPQQFCNECLKFWGDYV